MRILRPFFLLALLLPMGCYRYVNADPEGVIPGSQVRAQLTEAGIEEVGPYFGSGLEEVEGPLVRMNGEEVGILMRTYVSRPGFPPTSVADTVGLLPGHIRNFQVRELDGQRTAAMTALVVGAGVAAVLAPRVVGGGSGGEGPEGNDPDPNAQILLRIPLRLIFR
jgi:hypothetical protein